jgi:hypothetical protein
MFWWSRNEDGFNDLLATLIKALESRSAPESSAVAANEIHKIDECKVMNMYSCTGIRRFHSRQI